MGSRLVFLRSQLTRRRAPLSRLFPPHLPPPHYHLPSPLLHPSPPLILLATSIPVRHFSKHGSVNLILSDDSKPRFETLEADPPKKDKWLTKKRLKMQRKREKRKRNDANKRDPRRIRPKGKKTTRNRFPTAEDRIKYKIEKAKMKEAMLVERLKRYEVPKLQGPMPKPDNLTGEERFYMKKMAQKGSNYVPVGRRGVFGGVILNMHLHWKKHETVKVICKPCKPGQVQEYARDIARLSGGIPIQIIGDDTIIFYRGKNYVQPEEMSPIDTLSKKKALEKSKYEQSLETVRRFLAISEKELELYYRHVALYGDPATRDSILPSDDRGKVTCKLETRTLESKEKEKACSINDDISTDLSDTEDDSDDDKLSSAEVEHILEFTEGETDSENEELEFIGETDSESKELSEPEVDSEDKEQYVIGVQVHQPK